jgi:hypothetical protein
MSLQTPLQTHESQFMRKHPRREIEEQQPDEILQADAEQIELDTFLDAIGAEGSVKVKLYRLTPTGKQVFIQEGPPSIFSESSVQAEHGGGDYLLRSLLNGRWHRSKAFSVAPSLGTPAVPVRHLSTDAELEHLKVQLETQRVQLERQHVQMEADRKEREQRNHELMLKILENTRHETREGYQGPTLPELIASVKDLRALSGEARAVSDFRETLSLLREASSLLANADGASDWKAILAAAVAPILPSVIPPTRPSGTVNGVVPSATVSQPEPPSATNPVPDMPAMPTAYDQVAAQMRAVFERVRVQAVNGLDCGFVLDNLIALEEQGDPVARLILNSFEKSETFEAWLIWLRSMIGTQTMIDQSTMGFLSNLFGAARALPREEEEKEG